MIELRLLDYPIVKEIYEEYLEKEFTDDERKPLVVLKILMKLNIYECYGMYEDNELTGYAFMCRGKDGQTILLDYLEIIQKYRGQGYGSKILKLLQEKFADKKYLIAESKVLSEPSEDLIKLEILKMQFLRTYRKALKFFEEPIPNKNILPATSAYIKLLIDIKELIYEIDKQMNINSKNIEELTYLSGLKEYALFWSDKISNHLDCVFNTTLKYTNNQLTKDEMLKLNIQENIDFTSFADLPNILKLFDLEFSNAQNYELIKYDLNFLNKNFIENKAINDEIKKIIAEFSFLIILLLRTICFIEFSIFAFVFFTFSFFIFFCIAFT